MKLTEALQNSGVSAIVYGESGIGKTHFAGTLPGKTLIIAAEANGIKTLAKFPDAAKANLSVEFLPAPAKTIDDTSAQYNAYFDQLMLRDLGVDNVVLDSASELAATLLIQRTDPVKNGGAPTMKNYNEVQSSMRRYMRILRDLAILKGHNVLVLALEAEMVLSQTGDNTITSKAHPAMSGKKLAPEIEGLFDIVGHMEKLPDGRRFIRLEGTETFVAKDRFGRKGCFADGKIFLSGKTGNEQNTNTKEK